MSDFFDNFFIVLVIILTIFAVIVLIPTVAFFIGLAWAKWVLVPLVNLMHV